MLRITTYGAVIALALYGTCSLLQLAMDAAVSYLER